MFTFCLSLWIISPCTIIQVHTGKEKTHVDQFGLQKWKRLIRKAKPSDWICKCDAPSAAPSADWGWDGWQQTSRYSLRTSRRHQCPRVRVSVRFWLCFDWQATCAVRCGGMHMRPQASFLNRLPCVFSLCILETIDRKHHVRFPYIADVCRLWDSSYSFSFRLIWSSFNLTKTPASPPLTRWTNSPSFAPKMTLKSDGKSV